MSSIHDSFKSIQQNYKNGGTANLLGSMLNSNSNDSNLINMTGYPSLSSHNNFLLNSIDGWDTGLSEKSEKSDAKSEVSKTEQAFLNDFDTALKALKVSSSALSSYGTNGVFNDKVFGSSNKNVAKVTGGSKFDTEEMAILVKQIATGQTTETNAINSKKSGSLSGKNSISITTGDGKTTKLDFNFSNTLSAKEAMNEIAKSVNNAETGVTASVVEKDGKSSLQFTSNDTGEASSFKIEMSEKFKAELAPKITTEAKLAIYTIDDKEYTSQSNEVKIGPDEVSVTLTGTGEATLAKRETDSTEINDAIKTFINDLNKAIKFTSNEAKHSSSMRELANSLASIKKLSSTLGEIGIDTWGKEITVDEKKLMKALEEKPDRVKSILGGSSGIVNRITEKVNEALMNPLKFYS